MYCKACDINWATLKEQSVIDETYSFCPQCKSDRHLEETREGQTFVKSPFGNEIKCVQTGQLVREEKKIVPYQAPKKFDVIAWQDEQDRKQLVSVAAVDAYTEIINGGGSQEEAEAAHRKTQKELNEKEAIERYWQVFNEQGPEAAENLYSKNLVFNN